MNAKRKNEFDGTIFTEFSNLLVDRFSISINLCSVHYIQSHSSNQFLLTLASERYTIYFYTEESLYMSVYKTIV